MKILLNEPEPVQVSPQMAASLFVGRRHLVFAGSPTIKEHRLFLDRVLTTMPDQCSMITTRVGWIRREGTERVVVLREPSAPDTEPPGTQMVQTLIVIFAPNTLANRLAVGLLLVDAGGPEAIAGMVRTKDTIEAPVVLLAAPKGSAPGLARELEVGYAVLSHSFDALLKGEAIDTASN